MRIISWNVNGIRSVFKKDFLQSLKGLGADIVCLQEIKARESDFVQLFSSDLFQEGPSYRLVTNPGMRRGYSGVAVLGKTEPNWVDARLGLERFDAEGRIIAVEYPDFTLLNVYLPHGDRAKVNLSYKLEAYGYLTHYLEKFADRDVILVGDFNVARTKQDLARREENVGNTMFTPEERGALENLLNFGFVDSFRQFHEEGGQYTWWPYAFNARERNLGWRIDYIFVSKSLAPELKGAFILSTVRGSDHCPVGIEI
jgi:exodeoxyribonuclease-3